jgi:hypothetical protein
MTIDSNELIRILPAMLQGRRKFAKMADGGNYHIGKVDEWCLSYADVVKAIEDFCEYKKTGKYKLSAPIDGNWNVLNAYQYEPRAESEVR